MYLFTSSGASVSPIVSITFTNWAELLKQNVKIIYLFIHTHFSHIEKSNNSNTILRKIITINCIYSKCYYTFYSKHTKLKYRINIVIIFLQ